MDICSSESFGFFSHLELRAPDPDGHARGAFVAGAGRPNITVFRGPDQITQFDTVSAAYNRSCDLEVFAASEAFPNGTPLRFMGIGSPQLELEGDDLVLYVSSSDVQISKENISIRSDLIANPPLQGTILRVPVVGSEEGSAPKGVVIASGVNPRLAGVPRSGQRFMATRASSGDRPAPIALWRESEDGAWARSPLSDKPVYCGMGYDLLHIGRDVLLAAWHYEGYVSERPIMPASVSLGIWRYTAVEDRWLSMALPNGQAITIDVPKSFQLPRLYLLGQPNDATPQVAIPFLIYGSNPESLIVEPLSQYLPVSAVSND